MPRKSAASLSVIPLDSRRSRLRPPASLSEAARTVFLGIVTGAKSNHFQATDLPLLVRYCEAAVLAQEAAEHLRLEGPVVIAGRISPWMVIQEKSVRSLVALSMRLRLSPQSRAANNPSRRQEQTPAAWRVADRGDA